MQSQGAFMGIVSQWIFLVLNFPFGETFQQQGTV